MVLGFKAAEIHATTKTNKPESRIWDLGMEFGDVGCLRTSNAMHSNQFPTHFQLILIENQPSPTRIRVTARSKSADLPRASSV